MAKAFLVTFTPRFGEPSASMALSLVPLRYPEMDARLTRKYLTRRLRKQGFCPIMSGGRFLGMLRLVDA